MADDAPEALAPLPGDSEKESKDSMQKPEETAKVEVFSKVLMVETENLEHEPFESNNEIKVC